jgi:pyruvate kinase
MMDRIARETEAGNMTAHLPRRVHLTQEQAVSHAARALAEEASVRAIVVFTRSGASAHLISNDRPRTPVLAYTPSERVYRQLSLWWGVYPHLVPLAGTTEELLQVVEKRLMEIDHLQPGEHVVVMGGMPLADKGRTNFVKLHRIGE